MVQSVTVTRVWLLVICLSLSGCSVLFDSDSPHQVVANPEQIDGVVANPNAGVSVESDGTWQAKTRIYYLTWAQLQPTPDDINFALIDAELQSASRAGQTLGLAVYFAGLGGELPPWLDSTLTAGVSIPWPDPTNQNFRTAHKKLISSLGSRYNGHPALGHVMITAGCWGIWNANCTDASPDILSPNPGNQPAILEAYRELIDNYVEAFGPIEAPGDDSVHQTPLVITALGYDSLESKSLFTYAAIDKKTGWMANCWGDWGLYGESWTYQDDGLPGLFTGEYRAVWERSPVHLVPCESMEQWQEQGWTADPDAEVDRSFTWATDHHASLIHRDPVIPAIYEESFSRLLETTGYRLAIESLEHPSRVDAQGDLAITLTVNNSGVAPPYHRRRLQFRLRGETSIELHGDADIRRWLPGTTEVSQTLSLPDSLPPGRYAIDVGLLHREGESPYTEPLEPLALAIAGRDADGWYEISSIQID